MKSLLMKLSVFSFAVVFVFSLFLLTAPVYADDEEIGPSQSSHQSTYTAPDGSTVTRSTTRVWDPETQTWKTGVITTDEEGKTVTRYTEAEKTEDGYTRKSAVEGPDGQTTGRIGRGTWDPETKTWKREAAQMGPEGGTAYKEVEVKKSDEGYTRDSAVADSEGSGATRKAKGVWDPETKTWKKGVTKTGPEGKAVTRQSEWKRGGKTDVDGAENQ